MSPHPPSLRRLRTARVLQRERSRVERSRLALADGATTTLHVASYDLEAFDVRVAALDRPAPLVRWCEQEDVRHAVVGGFFIRREGIPLGELRIDGEARSSVPFAA